LQTSGLDAETLADTGDFEQAGRRKIFATLRERRFLIWSDGKQAFKPA
jgi:hypothetical protein